MAEQLLELKLKVNADTGALEVLSQGLKRAGTSAQETEKSFLGLKGAAAEAAAAIGAFASATAIIKFFKDAVVAAEEDRIALERIGFALEANGVQWAKNKEEVMKWGEGLQQVTRFSNTEAYEALGRFIRVTGDLRQSQTLVQTAMGMSAASGKDLNTTIESLTMLMSGNERSIRTLRQEYGSFIGNATTTKDVMKELVDHFYNAAQAEQGLTKDSHQLKNAFEDFEKEVGSTFAPAVQFVIELFTSLLQKSQELGVVIAGVALSLGETLGHVAKITFDLFTGQFKKARDESIAMVKDIEQVAKDSADSIVEIEKRKEAQLSAIRQSPANITPRLDPKVLQKEAEMYQRALQMEAELDQSIAALGQQTLAKKLAQLDAEVKGKQAAAQKEKLSAKDLADYLDKLNIYKADKEAELRKEKLERDVQLSFQTADTALRTLMVLNDLGSKGNQADKNRAIALLALQQAIAIGWIWVGVSKGVGEASIWSAPAAVALGAAQTALTISNFVQQVQAINKTSTVDGSGISSLTLGDTGIGQPTGSGGDSGGGISIGGGTGIVNVGGGSGGGGGGPTINVGGVVINFSTDHIDLDNVNAILLKLAQQIRSSTVEAVQFAVATQNLADKNNKLAV